MPINLHYIKIIPDKIFNPGAQTQDSWIQEREN